MSDRAGSSRLAKVERVLAVQRQLNRLAEWNLAALDRKRGAVASSRESLVRALGRDDPLHGLFVEAMARRLTALARESDALDRARAAVSRRLAEEALRMKRTERATARLRRACERVLGKQAFAELLDRLGRPDDASLP